MKKITITFIAILLASNTFAQRIIKEVPSFDKIVVSPMIDVIIVASQTERVTIEYSNINPRDINCRVEDGTLQLFLTDGDFSNVTKNTDIWDNIDGWADQYKNAKIQITVNYQNLEDIKLIGDQVLTARNTLKSKRLKLTLMGDHEVSFENIEVDNLTVNVFGDNFLAFENGYAENQKFRVFGDNEIIANELKGRNVKAQLFGDNQLLVNASNDFKVNSFGDSEAINSGRGNTSKGLVLGDNEVY